MYKSILSTICILMLVFSLSCKNNNNQEAAISKITIGKTSIVKSMGRDCDKPDSLRFSCAAVNLNIPTIEQGTEALKNSVAQWANSYMVGVLMPEADSAALPKISIDTALQSFFKEFEALVKEAGGDTPMTNFTAESTDTVLLNDGRYLTLEMTGYIFTGGAHGSPLANVATFDVQSGKQLTWDDLVTDKAALKVLAEKKFMEERVDIFKPTDGMEPFKFDDIFKFDLPQNYGLTKDGIYCHYVPYEVGPYAIGSTVLVISFKELGDLYKMKK